jgi:hypothetical protein
MTLRRSTQVGLMLQQQHLQGLCCTCNGLSCLSRTQPPPRLTSQGLPGSARQSQDYSTLV